MTKHDALRKQRIIDYIAATVRESGYPPSVREIAAAVGLASTSAVHHHLSALEKEGKLERDATQSRALRLTPAAMLVNGAGSDILARGSEHRGRDIPVIGEIAAGGPIEAYQDATETVTIPDMINTSDWNVRACAFAATPWSTLTSWTGTSSSSASSRPLAMETSSWRRSKRTRSR